METRSKVEFWRACVVWGVWFLMLSASLLLAASYPVNIPWADEWSHASVISGEQPLSIVWLWEQHNEHRIPIPKLIWILSLRLSHYNFRLLVFLQILALAAICAALLASVKELRHKTAITDAFFPLIILSPAQYENLLWDWQIGFVLPLILVMIVLLLIVENAKHPKVVTWSMAVLAGICTLLLPLCGAVGLACAPALILWLSYMAMEYWRSNDSVIRRMGLYLFLTDSAVLLLAFFYLHDLKRPVQIPVTPGIRASLRTSLEVLSGSFGQNAGKSLWPLVGSAVLIAIAIGCGVLARAWTKPAYDHPSTLGFLLLLAAALSLALGIGWGRSGFGPNAGFASRYVTLMIPAISCLYFIAQIYTSPVVGRLTQTVLLLSTVFVLPMNAREAIGFRNGRAGAMTAFQRDVMAGVDASVLAERYAEFLDPPWESPQAGAEAMHRLQRAQVGMFRFLSTTEISSAASSASSRIEGTLDMVDGQQVTGWVWDQSRPDKAIQVEIHDGNTLLATVDAAEFRPDLLAAHKGRGDHSFAYSIPPGLRDGRTHTIRVVVSSGGFELTGSPKLLSAQR